MDGAFEVFLVVVGIVGGVLANEFHHRRRVRVIFLDGGWGIANMSWFPAFEKQRVKFVPHEGWSVAVATIRIVNHGVDPILVESVKVRGSKGDLKTLTGVHARIIANMYFTPQVHGGGVIKTLSTDGFAEPVSLAAKTGVEHVVIAADCGDEKRPVIVITITGRGRIKARFPKLQRTVISTQRPPEA